MEEKVTEINTDDITLNGNVATWEMRAEGTVLGTYSGTFTFRCFLTPLQKIAADREHRSLLGDSRAVTPDYDHVSFMAYALTQLKQRIIGAPPFWSSAGVDKSHSGDIPDEDILERILDAAVRAELKYKKEIAARKEALLKRANEGAKVLEEKQKEEDSDEILNDHSQ